MTTGVLLLEEIDLWEKNVVSTIYFRLLRNNLLKTRRFPWGVEYVNELRKVMSRAKKGFLVGVGLWGFAYDGFIYVS